MSDVAIKGLKDAKLARDKLFDALPDNSLAIMRSPPRVVQSADVEYFYSPDRNFFRLTHLKEPEYIAVFKKRNGRNEYHLFIPKKSDREIAFGGKGLDRKDLIFKYGADHADYLDNLPDKLQEWSLKTSSPSIRRLPHTTDDNLDTTEVEAKPDISFWALDGAETKVLPYLKQLAASSQVALRFDESLVNNLTPILQSIRSTASEYEQAQMQEAADISIFAHEHALAYVHPKGTERQVQLVLEYFFKILGNHHELPYPPIVDSKYHSLHYEDNSELLKDGDLLLIDAAAQTKDFYACDITRTYPVNGIFSNAQRAVYEKVLETQRALIEMCVPGTKIQELKDACTRLTTQALIDLNILSGDIDQLIKDKAAHQYMPHGFGHWIMLDTHDPMPYTKQQVSEVLTKTTVPTMEAKIRLSMAKFMEMLQQIVMMVKQFFKSVFPSMSFEAKHDSPEAELKVSAGIDQTASQEPSPSAILDNSIELKPNMYLTIEPGLYFQHNDASSYKGIAVRIEDVIKVNEVGEMPTVITAALPKEPDDIEKVMASIDRSTFFVPRLPIENNADESVPMDCTPDAIATKKVRFAPLPT